MMKTRSFKRIIDLKEKSITPILEQLRDEDIRGMSFILLLETITKENKSVSRPITDKIVAVTVRATVNNWLDWGFEQGYIQQRKRSLEKIITKHRIGSVIYKIWPGLWRYHANRRKPWKQRAKMLLELK